MTIESAIASAINLLNEQIEKSTNAADKLTKKLIRLNLILTVATGVGAFAALVGMIATILLAFRKC